MRTTRSKIFDNWDDVTKEESNDSRKFLSEEEITPKKVAQIMRDGLDFEVIRDSGPFDHHHDLNIPAPISKCQCWSECGTFVHTQSDRLPEPMCKTCFRMMTCKEVSGCM